MTCCTVRLTALTAAFVLGLGLAGQPAAARQSDADLRKENQELKTKVKDLESEQEAARREIETLKAKIAQLEQQLTAALRRRPGPTTQPSSPVEDEKVTIDETIPTASPRALFKALQTSYQETMKDMEIGKPGDRQRTAYLRKLQAWASRMEREYHKPVEWHVRVDKAWLEDINRDRSGERIVRFQPVDPETDVKVGDPFDAVASKTLALRMEELEDRGELDVLVLKGTLVPRIRVNEERSERGSFDNPRFIGPFAEFEYTVEPTSVRPVEEDQADDKKAPTTRPAEKP